MSIITNKYSYQKHPDGDDNPFDDDYLMQVHNRKAAITADDAYEDYSNPDTRRRDRTRAPEIFKYVDDTKQYQGIAVDDDKHYEKLALDFGTSYDLARGYNLGGQMDKDRIKQGVNTALEWEAKATGKQRAVQRNAAEMIGNYNMFSNAPKMGMDYTDMGGLPRSLHVGVRDAPTTPTRPATHQGLVVRSILLSAASLRQEAGWRGR